MGYCVTSEGLKPDDRKIEAILKTENPADVKGNPEVTGNGMTLIEVPAWPLKRYAAHQKKECVFIEFALECFHQYTFGRRTTVHSEHKPLEMIV